MIAYSITAIVTVPVAGVKLWCDTLSGAWVARGMGGPQATVPIGTLKAVTGQETPLATTACSKLPGDLGWIPHNPMAYGNLPN